MTFPATAGPPRTWRFYEYDQRRDIPSMEVLDFIRALNERPAWVKLLFRLVVGKYAYREFLFVVKNIRDSGYGPFYDYGLNHHEYHADEQPWLWWKSKSSVASGKQ